MNKAKKQPLTPQEQAELAKLAAMPDEQIDYSDIVASFPKQWRKSEHGKFYRPTEKPKL